VSRWPNKNGATMVELGVNTTSQTHQHGGSGGQCNQADAAAEDGSAATAQTATTPATTSQVASAASATTSTASVAAPARRQSDRQTVATVRGCLYASHVPAVRGSAAGRHTHDRQPNDSESLADRGRPGPRRSIQLSSCLCPKTLVVVAFGTRLGRF